ncbi:3-hydroxyacyl-ACP dehydratase FabZ family protein [Eudoraea chungangensis]|uniref:3-hydroxyacyl-ACP dehydratase FabZ family protein n=1 Tax=Eudoraea chungangensis TaxID=1481905 RepID=UPI0023ED343A|nr:3-hydroxyacyl-ACP dehydratase FabZ family protein [Eudoraea chungangensis]
MAYKEILEQLPYTSPFLFVDRIIHLDEDNAVGEYTFKKELDFYRGHFKDNPVTPGVILTECCAQIGLVCLGLYLIGKTKEYNSEGTGLTLSSSNMEFISPLYPGQKVKVISEKIYFRFNKLKCKVKMFSSKEELICKGEIAGFIKPMIE